MLTVDCRQIKPEPSYAGQCSTGPQQCCDKVQNADAPQAAQALGSLGLQVAADVLVGLTCTPITVIGVASGSTWLALFVFGNVWILIVDILQLSAACVLQQQQLQYVFSLLCLQLLVNMVFTDGVVALGCISDPSL